MSSLLVTSFAIPFFIKLFVPIPFLFSKLCGIAKTSFPCSFANLAVTLVPLLYFASTIMHMDRQVKNIISVKIIFHINQIQIFS